MLDIGKDTKNINMAISTQLQQLLRVLLPDKGFKTAGSHRDAIIAGVEESKTYADEKAAEAVKKTGDETIGGVKTFTSAPVVPDATAAQHPVTLNQGVLKTQVKQTTGNSETDLMSQKAVTGKIKKLYINNYWYDGYFLRKDKSFSTQNANILNQFADIQTPVGPSYLHVKGDTPTSSSKVLITRNITRTFKQGEKWVFTYIIKSPSGAISTWCYTNMTGSVQEILYPNETIDMGEGWFAISFYLSVTTDIINPFIAIELYQPSVTEAYIGGIHLSRDNNQDTYDTMLALEQYMVNDIKIVKELQDDRNIILDPYFINGIPSEAVYLGSAIKSIESVETPEGIGNSLKITSAINFSFSIKISPHGLQPGDKITLSYLVYAGGTSIGNVWCIAFFNGGMDQQYSPVKENLGSGWWRYTMVFTINEVAAASSWYQVGAFVQSMANTPSNYILISGYKIIYPITRYKYPIWSSYVKKLKSDSDLFRSKSIKLDLLPKSNVINIWGDSLTASSHLTTSGIETYPSILQSLLGQNYIVNNFGVGGEKTTQIAARQGGNQLMIENIEGVLIPADKTPVAIQLNVGSLLLQGDAGINPCKICGIDGNITLSGGVYYFTRLNNGISKKAKYNSQIFTNAQLNNRSGIIVIGSGTNDAKSTEIDRLSTIDLILKMIRNSRSYDQIIMLPHSHLPDYVSSINLMKKEFGVRCVDVRDLMINDGLYDAINNGWIQDAIDNASYSASNAYKHINSYSDVTLISFSGTDTDYLSNATVIDDIENKRVPSIFMKDGTHFNIIGLKLQAKYLYDRLKLLELI